MFSLSRRRERRTRTAAPPGSLRRAAAQRPPRGRAEALREGLGRRRSARPRGVRKDAGRPARRDCPKPCAQFAAQREGYFQRVESEVVQLALSIARKILHREAQIDPLLLAGIVRVALESLNDGTQVRLRANPAGDSLLARLLQPRRRHRRRLPNCSATPRSPPAAACWKPSSAARRSAWKRNSRRSSRAFSTCSSSGPEGPAMSRREPARSLFSPPGRFLHLPLGRPRHQGGRLPGGIGRPVLLRGRRLRHPHLRRPHPGRRNRRASAAKRFFPCRSNGPRASATATASSPAARAPACAWDRGCSAASSTAPGEPLDSKGPYGAREYWPLRGDAPLPLTRTRIREPLGCGIRAIDGC